MKEFINKWSSWWILSPKRKQLDEAFKKELNELQSEQLKAFADYSQKRISVVVESAFIELFDKAACIQHWHNTGK